MTPWLMTGGSSAAEMRFAFDNGCVVVHDLFVLLIQPAPNLAPPDVARCDVVDRFALILDGLCAAVAARMAGLHKRSQPGEDLLPGRVWRGRAVFPLLMLLWGRLRRMSGRFGRLAARAAAGAVKPRPPAGPRPARPPGQQPSLPRGIGWLVRLLPQANGYGSQLQHLMSEPAFAALLAAAPQAARLVRPLCRMLAVSTPAPPSPPTPTPPAADPSDSQQSGIDHACTDRPLRCGRTGLPAEPVPAESAPPEPPPKLLLDAAA